MPHFSLPTSTLGTSKQGEEQQVLLVYIACSRQSTLNAVSIITAMLRSDGLALHKPDSGLVEGKECHQEPSEQLQL
ncbi:hypothetical protein P7K49_024666 [Saguinus oedipus]|uniref:Uncharacterized protein n=1 Tax=Saguinus oedipus TaxID=9490 RepID=A0ABQ9UQ56_SAGOE|nr:hypothetical protein P7K49_024666 [Saguinus oedipus]